MCTPEGKGDLDSEVSAEALRISGDGFRKVSIHWIYEESINQYRKIVLFLRIISLIMKIGSGSRAMDE